jgi:hypothetical protein
LFRIVLVFSLQFRKQLSFILHILFILTWFEMISGRVYYSKKLHLKKMMVRGPLQCSLSFDIHLVHFPLRHSFLFKICMINGN